LESAQPALVEGARIEQTHFGGEHAFAAESKIDVLQLPEA